MVARESGQAAEVSVLNESGTANCSVILSVSPDEEETDVDGDGPTATDGAAAMAATRRAAAEFPRGEPATRGAANHSGLRPLDRLFMNTSLTAEAWSPLRGPESCLGDAFIPNHARPGKSLDSERAHPTS